MVCLFSLNGNLKVKQDYGSNWSLSKPYQHMLIPSGTKVMAVHLPSRTTAIVLQGRLAVYVQEKEEIHSSTSKKYCRWQC